MSIQLLSVGMKASSAPPAPAFPVIQNGSGNGVQLLSYGTAVTTRETAAFTPGAYSDQVYVAIINASVQSSGTDYSGAVFDIGTPGRGVGTGTAGTILSTFNTGLGKCFIVAFPSPPNSPQTIWCNYTNNVRGQIVHGFDISGADTTLATWEYGWAEMGASGTTVDGTLSSASTAGSLVFSNFFHAGADVISDPITANTGATLLTSAWQTASTAINQAINVEEYSGTTTTTNGFSWTTPVSARISALSVGPA